MYTGSKSSSRIKRREGDLVGNPRIISTSQQKRTRREQEEQGLGTVVVRGTTTNNNNNSSSTNTPALTLSPSPSTSSDFSGISFWIDLTPSPDLELGTTTEPPGSTGTRMNFSSDFALSDEYLGFRSSVPLKKVAVEADSSKVWKMYDAGPRSVRTPLVCLPPVSGTADVFYRQMLSLTLRGIRVIAVEAPVYWCIQDWCEGFKKLLDHMDITKVHLFGASLGGFLAQKFAEYTFQYSRVASIILCNSFRDTSIFNYNQSATVFWMMPSIVLKKFIIGNLESSRMDLSIARSIDFMTERLDSLEQSELASRLTLTCVNNYVDTFKLRNVKITMVDVFDESALTNQARDDLYKSYPHAKLAHLKSGGNFPYLSRSDELNMHLLIHLRQFNGTKFSASERKEDEVIDVAAGIVIQQAPAATPAKVI